MRRRHVLAVRGATLLEVLAAVAVLAVLVGVIASVLSAWGAAFRRTETARRCREAAAAFREASTLVQPVCRQQAAEWVRQACRAVAQTTDGCRTISVQWNVAPGLGRGATTTEPASIR